MIEEGWQDARKEEIAVNFDGHSDHTNIRVQTGWSYFSNGYPKANETLHFYVTEYWTDKRMAVYFHWSTVLHWITNDENLFFVQNVLKQICFNLKLRDSPYVCAN